MSNKNLFPTEVKTISSFNNIKYLEGLPREYRFNAKTGILTKGADHAMTDRGESFSIIPIAYRLFSAEMFQYEARDWAELFFINEAGHVSCLMFHGYSVESLRQTMADLFYEDVSLTQVILTCTPVQKSNEYGSYYILSFKAKPLTPGRDQNFSAELTNTLAPIFQYKTASVHAQRWVSMNMPELGPDIIDTPMIDQSGDGE